MGLIGFRLPLLPLSQHHQILGTQDPLSWVQVQSGGAPFLHSQLPPGGVGISTGTDRVRRSHGAVDRGGIFISGPKDEAEGAAFRVCSDIHMDHLRCIKYPKMDWTLNDTTCQCAWVNARYIPAVSYSDARLHFIPIRTFVFFGTNQSRQVVSSHFLSY